MKINTSINILVLEMSVPRDSGKTSMIQIVFLLRSMRHSSKCRWLLSSLINNKGFSAVMEVLDLQSKTLRVLSKFKDHSKSSLDRITQRTTKKFSIFCGVTLMKLKKRAVSNTTMSEILKSRITW